MAWTDPRTWIAGETVTAALMNTHVRDNLKALGDPWTEYTPTWTALATNPTLGNGTLTGRFLQVGKLVIFRIQLTFGSTTSAGQGTYFWTLPATAARIRQAIGDAVAFDVSPDNIRLGNVLAESTTACSARGFTDIAFNHANPFTWATNDEIHISGIYEAA